MLRDAEIDLIRAARHGDPFSVLGPHAGDDGRVRLRVFLPGATRVEVLARAGDAAHDELTPRHADGFFEGLLTLAVDGYKLRAHWGDGGTSVLEDPYRFPPVLGDTDTWLLAEGTHLRPYEVLGATARELEGVAGTAFAVWAPNASRVSVVGDFNRWDGRRHGMRLRRECGVWEIFVPGVAVGAAYKYEIRAGGGELLPLKADPFALQAELRPATASVVGTLPARVESSIERERANGLAAPISVYEVHLGSWRRHVDGNRFLSWSELADTLVPYAKDMGFTHLELLPISEFPFDGSWGYQPVGLYAPTARFGDAAGFGRFVERCHAEGLGVLLDWVPAHFPSDAHGLARFDGTALYEHADPREGFHQDWNTLIFNYGRREVVNYLIANALSWLENFHVDGLRVDAVASMLYLDYSRKAGEWVPNKFGGRENLDAVDFLRRFNELVFEQAPGATTAAEESTAWPMVSAPTYLGGLGFGFKWNMGWMHDTLQYMSLDPIHRKYHHNQLTFGLLYAFTENFILPLSHDEVVHGKGSLLGKMPGDRWQKFANLRAYYAFMWAHPGKKLMFMGCELAQEREWNHDGQLDWHLLDDPLHGGMHRLMRDLNQLYRSETALHRLDALPEGFAWVDATDSDQSVLSFLRFDAGRRHMALVLCNFTPQPRYGYRVGVPRAGRWIERLNSDAGLYGGSDLGNAGGVVAEAVPWHGHSYSILATLPPLATLILTAQPT